MQEWQTLLRRGQAQDIVKLLLDQAVRHRVSDIHIEPMDQHVRVRLRRDGVLHTAGLLEKERLDMVTARIKIMASMDVANKRLPQDGRFVWTCSDHTVDMRISTMPTVRGEKTVIRLLDAQGIQLDLDCLGMDQAVVALLRDLTRRKKGLFLYGGATGSGKTTTLYSVLRELDRPEISIATLEDPVEYKIDGICQSQIHAKGGLVFQNGLRALLRQDPDILVIGEIRDAETAQIAVQAALTGHVVFSTLHISQAAEAPLRLLDMGVEPYLVADALLGITSQQLARRRCPHCQGRQGGCAHCLYSGYDGRFCLCEVIPVNSHMRQGIRQRVSTAALQEAAQQDGAILMDHLVRQSLASGMTDRAEIRRIYYMGEGRWN